jgi:tetratricopeptide (TPR) repeat protein
MLAGCDAPDEKAQGYYQRGVQSVAAGDLDKAALDFRNALKIRDEFPEARLALAELEEKRGNFDDAVRLYRSAAEQDPKHLDPRLRLAQLLLAMGRTDEAAVQAAEASRLSPEDARVMVLEAGIALKRGNRKEAVKLANAALRTATDDPTALMVLVSERIAAADPTGALALIERGVARHPSDPALQLARLRTLQQMGDAAAIEQQHARMIELFPGNPAFHDGLIDWYVAQGRNSDAERAARRFAREHAEDETAQIKLVRLLRRTQGPEAALAEVNAIITNVPQKDAARLAALRIAAAEFEAEAGKPDAAVATLRDVAASTPERQARRLAQLRLAQTLAAKQQWEQATEASNAVLAEEAGNAEALIVRATARLAMGENARAIEDLVLAQGHAAGAPGIALLLAEGHERMGATALAEEQYRKALALSRFAPANGIKLAQFLLRHGRSAAALSVLDELRTSGTADAASLTLLAQLKLGAGDTAGAQEIAALLRKTAGPSADQIEAAALKAMNRKDEAIALLRTAVAAAPERRDLFADLVRAQVDAGRAAEAEALVRQRIKDDATDARARLLLGSVLMAAGRMPEAEAEFRAAAETGRAGVQAATALTEFLLRTGRLEDAERTARQGLERHGDDSALRLMLAGILESLGKPDEAIAEYERLMRSDPTSTVVANNLASLLSERSDDPKALERAFNIAVRFQNSEVPQFLDTLGWIHYLRGDHHAALPLLKRAAEKLPKSGAVQFHLGMALKQAGEAELSARTLERAITLPRLPAKDLKTAAATIENLKANTNAN